MRGVRAKLLREQAAKMSVGQKDRETEQIALGQRWRWFEVPDTSGRVKTFLARFALALGIPVATKKERRLVSVYRVQEKKGTTRWCYRRLKRLFYLVARSC